MGIRFDKYPVINCCSSGLADSLIIRRRMGCRTHSDKHADKIQPDGAVSEPSEFLERADLADDEANNGPDETAHDEANTEFGGLRKSFAV